MIYNPINYIQMISKEIHMPQNAMPKHGKYNLVFWTKLTSMTLKN
jgi:hypothetical protein